MKTRLSTKYILLGTLMSGSKHGYEILRFLETEMKSTWYVSSSQLYTLLKKIEQEGLLQSEVEKQETLPLRRIFSLTNSGEKLFLDWVHSPTEHVRDFRTEFMAKIFFFYRLGLKGGPELIKAQVQVLEDLRGKIKSKQKKEKDPYNRLVLGSKLATIQTWLQWLGIQAMSFMRKVTENE